MSLPRARTNDVGVLFATISRDSPTVLSQQPRGLTLAIEYLRGDSTRDRSQMRVCCVPHETIGVCMTLSVCGLGVRNAPSPVVCHAHCPAGAVSVQGKNQTNPYSYITVERRSERTAHVTLTDDTLVLLELPVHCTLYTPTDERLRATKQDSAQVIDHGHCPTERLTPPLIAQCHDGS